MLYSLRRLLEPLFLFDLVTAAVERGEYADLRTLITAWWSPQWRAALTQPCVSDIAQQPDDLERHVLNWDRVPFDPASWDTPTTTAEFPLWKLSICPEGTRRAMSQIDRFGGRYTIESISNPGACSGETVTIRGKNFGPTGRVYFPSPEAGDPAFGPGAGNFGILVGVEPVSWTDTKIDVVVPPWG